METRLVLIVRRPRSLRRAAEGDVSSREDYIRFHLTHYRCVEIGSRFFEGLRPDSSSVHNYNTIQTEGFHLINGVFERSHSIPVAVFAPAELLTSATVATVVLL